MKGIYLITNTLNGKKYVGMSNNINRRFMEHKTPNNVANKTTVLAKAFRKYSVENFVFEILEIVNDINNLAEREIFWISELQPEYNMNDGGLGNKGYNLNAELISLLKLSGKLQWMSMTKEQQENQIKNNLVGPKIGHKVSIETRMKLRQKNLGKTMDFETKKKIANSNKISMIGNMNGNKKVSSFKSGQLIKTFDSILEAANFINVHPSNISKVLKGVQSTAGGYSWKYGV